MGNHKVTMSLPNNSETNRVGHWRPNDSLYFHKNVTTRSPTKPSWNEPYYQYRETKLEHHPRHRTSPTYQSSVFTPSTYVYSVNEGAFKTASQSQVSQQQTGGRRGETASQRQFQMEGYPCHSPSRKVP